MPIREGGGGWQGYVSLNCHSYVLEPGKYVVTCAERDAVQRSVRALWKEEDEVRENRNKGVTSLD